MMESTFKTSRTPMPTVGQPPGRFGPLQNGAYNGTGGPLGAKPMGLA